MEALKILIVEDDLLLAEQIADELVDFGYLITDTVHESNAAMTAFRKRLPDLVLMDINLNNSPLDGIELAHEFNKLARVPIIFLTALGGTQTVDRAKAVHPAYYLIKPCNSTQLRIALDVALANFVAEEQPKVEHSLQFHAPPPCKFYANHDFFFAKKGTKYMRIEVADIIWVEALGPNVRIFTETTNVTISANLKSFSSQVPHASLIKTHRSYIVNINKIVAFDGGRAFVNYQGEQKEIPVGATNKVSFQEQLPRLKSD